jgi:hypothetical protein
MNNLSIVVRARSDAILLRRLLSKRESIPLQFYAAEGVISLATVGRNILVHEGAPVLVVMDAETYNPRKAKEECGLVEMLLRRFSAEEDSAAFAFVPELEIVFFEAPSVLVRSFGPEIVSPSTLERGQYQPKTTLRGILQGAGISRESYFKQLGVEDIDELRRGNQLSRLIEVVEGLTVGVGR